MSPGDEPAPGLVVHEVGVICPDEVACTSRSGRVRSPWPTASAPPLDGSLGFFSDGLLGDDPEAIKAGLRAAYRRLAEVVAFDVLLFAHGDPIPSGGREALAAFGAG